MFGFGRRRKQRTKTWHSKVAGVTYPNDDGTSRQAILKKCRVGEALTLSHEPMPESPYAVAVRRASNGEQLGWLPVDTALHIAQKLQVGQRIDARISDLTGGGLIRKRTRGCNIELTEYL